jgi:hypothetical protein
LPKLEVGRLYRAGHLGRTVLSRSFSQLMATPLAEVKDESGSPETPYKQMLVELQRSLRKSKPGTNERSLVQFRSRLLGDFLSLQPCRDATDTSEEEPMVAWEHVRPLILETAKFGDWRASLDLYALTIPSMNGEAAKIPDVEETGTLDKGDQSHQCVPLLAQSSQCMDSDGAIATFVLAHLAESDDIEASRWMHRLHAMLPNGRRTAFQLDLLLGKCIEQCDHPSLTKVMGEFGAPAIVTSADLLEDVVSQVLLPHCDFDGAVRLIKDVPWASAECCLAVMEFALAYRSCHPENHLLQLRGDAEDNWPNWLCQVKALVPGLNSDLVKRKAFGEALAAFLERHLPPDSILTELEQIKLQG